MRYILALFCCLYIYHTLQAEQTPQQSTALSVYEQQSANQKYKGKLECENAITVGAFQECWLTITHKNTPVKNIDIIVSGGMPAHNHGLPTMPKVIWSDNTNNYQIKGLKFSMPGQWFLRFIINTKETELEDEIVFDFEIE